MSSEVKIIVSAETQQAAAALKNVTGNMNQLLGRTGVARDALQTFQRTANLIGFQAAPQLTSTIYLASDSWKTLSGTMKLAGLGAGATGLAIAGITATVATGVAAWQAYRAELQLAAATSRKVGQDLLNLGNSIIAIKTQVAQGRLTEAEGNALEKRLEAAKKSDAEKEEAAKVLNKGLGRATIAARSASGAFANMGQGRRRETGEEANKVVVERLKEVLLNDQQLKQVADLVSKEKQLTIDRLEGYEKERAAIEENFRLETIRIKALGSDLREQDAPLIKAATAANIAARDKALADSRKKEADEITQKRAAQLKIEQDITAEIRKREQAADAFYAREDAHEQQKAINKIQSDPFKTDAEKYRDSKAAGADMTGSVDPDSAFDNLRANMAALYSQFGTFSQGAAALVTNGIGTAIQGVSDGIMGLIDGTKSWAQVWGDYLRSMASQGIEFIVKQTAMFVLNKGKQLAVHIATESGMTATTLGQSALRVLSGLKEAGVWLVKTAVKAASSVADIPYVGWALALAALAGVLAVGKNAIDGARADGGPVKAGGTYLVGERGPELFYAPTDGSILSNPETMGVLSGGGSKASVNNSPQVNVANFIVANLDELVHRAMELPRGTKIIAQTIDGRRLDLGFDT